MKIVRDFEEFKALSDEEVADFDTYVDFTWYD